MTATLLTLFFGLAIGSCLLAPLLILGPRYRIKNLTFLVWFLLPFGLLMGYFLARHLLAVE
ncbi:MAG TPA: hypothetical protein VLV28_09535 [Gaiellaceae bacterium]|nr:hypothetical protein [Gaiellaceae bacterium]